MILRHRVSLAGVQLDSVDSRIMITKVDEGEGKEQFSSVSLWGGSGSRVTELHRDYLDVTVKFVVKLRKKEMQLREEVLEKVNAWAANGGWLTTNYKMNRRIRVFLMQPASIIDPWDWTREFSVVFRACGVPYWQESSGAGASKTNVSSGSMSLLVYGSVRSVMNANFTNSSGSTIDTFSINTGESAMSFTGLGLENGEKLVIDHTDDGKKSLLRIRIQNTSDVYRSAMSKRDATSDNDLFISPGSGTVSFVAGGAGSCVISCCGRFA